MDSQKISSVEDPNDQRRRLRQQQQQQNRRTHQRPLPIAPQSTTDLKPLKNHPDRINASLAGQQQAFPHQPRRGRSSTLQGVTNHHGSVDPVPTPGYRQKVTKFKNEKDAELTRLGEETTFGKGCDTPGEEVNGDREVRLTFFPEGDS